MNNVNEKATLRGIEAEYQDAFGRRHVVPVEVLARLVELISLEPATQERMLAPTVVARHGAPSWLALSTPGASGLIRWDIFAPQRICGGEATASPIGLPNDLPVGTFELRVTVTTPQGERSESATLLVAPTETYQGADTRSRLWALAVQLYAIRSRRNWGHGDFTDLLGLIDLASELGAAAVGLNPLHDVFGTSPYSPSSRLFLNPLYIDLDAVPEFAGLKTAAMEEVIDRLRLPDLLDDLGVRTVKWQALLKAYEAFRTSATPARRSGLERFRERGGALLRRFACFEVLRRRFGSPWSKWPDPWRAPSDELLERLYTDEAEQVGLFEFVQWLADQQLCQCYNHARDVGLSIGLYLDVAVGVRPDGFDAWNNQSALVPDVAVGAPPDPLNPDGQNWGLAPFNPLALHASKFAAFRDVLQAAMRYAGAIRLDHVLGLKRLYLVPSGSPSGAYIDFPLEPLLAVIAQESLAAQCIIIGEDLGTVPEHFRDTLARWGIWSYQVMLFERADDGSFLPPERYRRNGVAAFATHDLPTFAGWLEGSDLAMKAALAINPGESLEERDRARQALQRALSERGMPAFDFLSVARFLADSPSRLVLIAIEDVVGSKQQVNVPGTVDAYPNWRVRLPVVLEDLRSNSAVSDLAAAMQSAARGAPFRGLRRSKP
jgi:4-alpha-glucanotransferase